MIENVEPIYFKHLAYLKSKISSDNLMQLKEDADYILKNENQFKKYNSKLAGNLEKEYSVHKSKKILESDLIALANEYHKHLKENETYPNWNIKDIWINFQKKYEYNPLHNHTGDLSFVLWVQIPYNLTEELKLSNAKNSNIPSNSLFHFVYNDLLGRVVNSPIYLDKSWEGTIIMFPSTLNHMVYSFYTSDDYRISISGNLVATESKNNIFSYK
jgi:hypothetical protein